MTASSSDRVTSTLSAIAAAHVTAACDDRVTVSASVVTLTVVRLDDCGHVIATCCDACDAMRMTCRTSGAKKRSCWLPVAFWS